MDTGATHRVATRAASPVAIAASVVSLGHAALALAGIVEAPIWVPIVECLLVCAIGLSHLRQVSQAPETPADPPAPFAASVVPARLVAAPGVQDERVARR
jgi:hypothetical protein